MIDPKSERLLSLSEAAKLEWLPCRRHGKRPHVSTLFRWTHVGKDGVRLEAIQVAGTLCTSEAALIRFFERLTTARARGRLGIVTRTSGNPELAGSYLDAQGI